MKRKDKPRKDKLKNKENNLTQRLKQLKKHREKFEEQREKQGCRYPYHRKTKSTKTDVSVNVPVAKDTTTHVANPDIRADSNFDVKSSQAVTEAGQSSARSTAVINTPASPASKFASASEPKTVMTGMVRAGIAKTNTVVTAFSTSAASTSKFSKFVDVSKERPDKRFHRMEIWFANLGYHDWRCIEEGWHPVLIISNNANNEFTPIVTVAPITSKTNKLYLPGHVFIDATDVSDAGADIPNFSFRSGSVLLEQITVLDKRQLEKYAGKVISRERIGILNKAIISFLDLFPI